MPAIIESKDNIDAMVKSEREVLACIRTYMISGYEDRVEKYTVTDQNAKRNMTSTDSSLKEKFWNDVMPSFGYISQLLIIVMHKGMGIKNLNAEGENFRQFGLMTLFKNLKINFRLLKIDI